MGRRAHIFFHIIGALIWGSSGFLNWDRYRLDALASLTPVQLFSAAIAPILALVSLGQLWKLLTAPRSERVRDPHAVLVIAESLVVRIVRGLLLATMAAAGGWGLLHGVSVFKSFNATPIFNVFFLGIGAWGLITVAFTPRQQMTLTPAGLTHSQLRPKSVSWEDVAEVKSKTVLTTTTITLVLRDNREFRPASLLARWRRVSQLVLLPLAFGVDPEVLLEGIDIRRNVFTF